MAVTLPLKVEGWQPIRILTKSRWSSSEAWTDQPMVQMAPKPVARDGYVFKKCRRTAVDGDGTAVFAYITGKMDGRQYPAPPDLLQYEVRILQQDTAGAWHTIWWGTVEQQFDVDMAPGSDHAYGTREYHCLDGVAGRMRHWMLDRHGVYVSGGTQRPANSASAQQPCLGHPGFNIHRWDGKFAGNKETSGANYDPHADLTGTQLLGKAFYHTYPGNGNLFTDRQAVETAIAQSRPAKDVPFYLAGEVEYLACYSVWRVEHGLTMLEFLRRVMRRQRARGVAWCDWTESGDPISGTFTPKITINPQFLDSINFTPKGIDPNTGSAYAAVNLKGATDAGTSIDVDLEGDHRLGPNAASTFELGDRAAYSVQYLETEGEPIEVAITGAFNDTTPTVEKRFEDSQATAFKSATVVERARARYESVYQLFGLARDWGGKAWDGNAGSGVSSMTRADFRCDDNGDIQVPSVSDVGDTSAIVVEVMRDLPLYADYNYVQTYPSPRYDGLADDPVPPIRRAPLLLYRASASGSGRFLPLAPTPTNGMPALFSVTFQVNECGILVFVPGDQAAGLRTIGDPTATPTIGSAIAYTDLVFTIGLRLPHHVRFATAATDPITNQAYTRETAPRRKVLTVRDHHLWLAHVSAIWEVDSTAFSNGGYTPRRSAANGSEMAPGIIRDDRGALELIHRIAWNWWGVYHRTASWMLHACGMLPSFKTGADGSGSTNFPTLGQLVRQLSAAGQVYTLSTPITTIDYDHEQCTTRWSTDWSDLDSR